MKYLANAVTSTGAQTSTDFGAIAYAAGFQVWGKTSSGSGSASVNLEVSNDNTHFINVGTVTLTLGTSDTTDGFAVTGSYKYCRANITTLTGTGAQVTALLQE